ncbi:MAG: hypothetical protein KJ574_01555, partial [Nanoarchaeota archaeon]|nr:hypothetical protein [Nanoarchaeota archaeon]
LDLTGEAVKIKIMKSSKIQDGIVRLEFAAGRAADKFEKMDDSILSQTAALLHVDTDQIPARVEELFEKWKKAKKAVKKNFQLDLKELALTSTKRFSETVLADQQDKLDDLILANTSKVLSTQPQHIPNTVKRFLEELEGFKKQLKK